MTAELHLPEHEIAQLFETAFDDWGEDEEGNEE